VDALFARMKSNGKFQCESADGYVQKARHEGSMPDDASERDAVDGVKKYFLGDHDGLVDEASVVELEGSIEARLERVNEELWDVYGAWPNKAEAVLINGKFTWPLPFEGEESITSLMINAGGWSAGDMPGIAVRLFDESDTGRRAGCTREQVTWPDVQRIFCNAICKSQGVEWSAEMDVTYAALEVKNRLSLKVEREKIQELLMGRWRMYCVPQEGDPFSYGLIIKIFDDEKLTFSGTSAIPGRYEVEDGTVEYNNNNNRQHVYIRYNEAWPNGFKDALFARMKSNGKFQCESDSGFVQKARHEGSMPDDPAERDAAPGVKKYYIEQN